MYWEHVGPLLVEPPEPLEWLRALQTPPEQISVVAQQVSPHTVGALSGHPTHSPFTHCSFGVQQFLPQRVGALSGQRKQELWPFTTPQLVPCGQQRSAPHEMALEGQPQELEPPKVLQPPARQQAPPQRSG